MNQDTFRLKNIFENLDETFSKTIKEKELEFIIKTENVQDIWIESDERRVLQILKNFIANSIKFTQGGFVELSCEKEGYEIKLNVKDSGIGISTNTQKKIFEPFVQQENLTNRRYGGTGLGLSISNKLAKLLGGKIRIVSSLNKGSCFSLILPYHSSKKFKQKIGFEKPSTLPLSIPPKPLLNKLFKDKKIYLINDDIKNAYATSKFLLESGFDVDMENSPEYAFGQLEKGASVHFFIINIVKSQTIDIAEFVDKVRTIEEYKKTPILLFVEKRMDLAQTTLTQLVKPVELDELLVPINKFIP